MGWFLLIATFYIGVGGWYWSHVNRGLVDDYEEGEDPKGDVFLELAENDGPVAALVMSLTVVFLWPIVMLIVRHERIKENQ